MKVEEIKLSLENNIVQFGALQDIQSLLEKAEGQLKNAKELQKQLKSEYSNALIILDMNIPAQVSNAIKKANELGADDVVSKLTVLEKKAKDLSNQNMSTYKLL
jgi:hypothetical protein